jgi:cytochrome c553
MLAYKTGERTEPMMGMFMKALSDEDIANLAAYYASLSSKE